MIRVDYYSSPRSNLLLLNRGDRFRGEVNSVPHELIARSPPRNNKEDVSA